MTATRGKVRGYRSSMISPSTAVASRVRDMAAVLGEPRHIGEGRLHLLGAAEMLVELQGSDDLPVQPDAAAATPTAMTVTSRKNIRALTCSTRMPLVSMERPAPVRIFVGHPH
jgi:hypothetical protein